MYAKQAILVVFLSTSLTVLASPDNIGNLHGLKAGRDEVVAREPDYLDPAPRAVAIDERSNKQPRAFFRKKPGKTVVKHTSQELTEQAKTTHATTTHEVAPTTHEVAPTTTQKPTTSTKSSSSDAAPTISSSSILSKPTTLSSEEVVSSSSASSDAHITSSSTSSQEEPSQTSLSSADETEAASDPAETTDSGSAWPIDFSQVVDGATAIAGMFTPSSTDDTYPEATDGSGDVDDTTTDGTGDDTGDSDGEPTDGTDSVSGDASATTPPVGASGLISGAGAQATTGVPFARRAWANGLPRYVETTFITSTTTAPARFY